MAYPIQHGCKSNVIVQIAADLFESKAEKRSLLRVNEHFLTQLSGKSVAIWIVTTNLK